MYMCFDFLGRLDNFAQHNKDDENMRDFFFFSVDKAQICAGKLENVRGKESFYKESVNKHAAAA